TPTVMTGFLSLFKICFLNNIYIPKKATNLMIVWLIVYAVKGSNTTYNHTAASSPDASALLGSPLITCGSVLSGRLKTIPLSESNLYQTIFESKLSCT